jgi:S-adenosyl methyltransferase
MAPRDQDGAAAHPVDDDRFDGWAEAGVDPTKPNIARVYDYWLGGHHNLVADRELAEAMATLDPWILAACKANRAFLGRAVRFLARHGIRQFLDIGSGLPATGNVHEVAQAVAPQSRVVYVDNDPLVLVHARALLASAPEGRTGYIQADLRDPASILASPATRETLDFSQPVALVLCAILHFLADADNPAGILATLLGALPPGSYLVASHATSEHFPPDENEAALRAYRAPGITFQPRDSGDFARLAFAGLDLVPPGVVLASEWHPEDDAPRPPAAEVSCYGGVGRKPLRWSAV